MKAIERHRENWQGKSDEWLFERLDNELKQKVQEIHRLMSENEALRKPIVCGSLPTDEEINEEAYKRWKPNISNNISGENHLTKDEVISTGDWFEADGIGLTEGYFWKHKNIQEDGHVFYMRRNNKDGFTTIKEEGTDNNKLFEGYIKNLEELKQAVHLCRLHEI